MVALAQTHKFTVHEYQLMVKAEVFGPEAWVELIEGEILQVNPIGNEHQWIVDHLTRLFVRAVGDLAVVRVQGSFRAGEYSEPQPDLCLLRPRKDRYRTGFALAEDVILLVEVAVSSIKFDRTVKGPLYARSGIPELWIVDVTAGKLEVLLRPSPTGYLDSHLYGPGDRVSPQSLPEVVLEAGSILG